MTQTALIGMTGLFVPLSIVVLLLLPCLPRMGTADAEIQSSGWDSPFGIDYVFPLIKHYQNPDLPRIFAKTGVRWVNFAGPGLGWQNVEPRPPKKGKHNYQWKTLDKAVVAWQEQEFNIVMTLTCGSTWGGGPITGKILLLDKLAILGKQWGKKVDRLPAPEHMEDYRAYIKALVERYDGDGENDMPGLRKPILYYQIGNEYVHEAFWGGTLEDYGVLLKETSTATKAVNPKVKIILAGITWNDLFHNDLTGDTFEERLQAKLTMLDELGRKGWEKACRFTEGELKFARWYDIIDARGNGPYPNAFPGYIQWLKKEMKKNGVEKEIWDIESRSEPAILYKKSFEFHPEAYTKNGIRLIRRMDKVANREKSDLWQWYRAEQARQTVKVLATRLGAGVEKVFIGFPTDLDFNALAKLGAGGNPWHGFLDKNYKPQPAYYAYGQFVSKVGGFNSITQKIHNNIWHYAFTGPQRSVHVIWYDDGSPPDPKKVSGTKKVSLSVGSQRVRVTPTVTSLSELSPQGEVVSVSDRKVMLTLTGTPVFIEELSSQ